MARANFSPRLLTAYLLALALQLSLPSWSLWLHLSFFIPPVILSFYQKPMQSALWFAAICGLTLDLIASDERFGLFTISYVFTAFALIPMKRYFFEDSITTLPTLTFFFASLSGLLHLIFYTLFEGPPGIDASYLITDLLLMPIVDAGYAFLVFGWPGLWTPKKLKREYFSRS